MSHERYLEMLAIRGYLSAEDEDELSGHLADCDRCRAVAERYQQQDLFLRRVAWPVPPATLRKDVWDHIDRRVPWYRRMSLRNLVPLVAVLIVGAALLPALRLSSPGAASLDMARRAATNAQAFGPLKAVDVTAQRAAPVPVEDAPLRASGKDSAVHVQRASEKESAALCIKGRYAATTTRGHKGTRPHDTVRSGHQPHGGGRQSALSGNGGRGCRPRP